MLRFAQGVSSSFDVTPNRAHVGVIVFSEYAKIAFPFDAEYSSYAVYKLIGGLKQQKQAEVRIDRALQTAYKDLFSARYGARTKARKV